MPELTRDELVVLNEFRRLVGQRHGDIEISVKDGALVKVWRVEKLDLRDHLKLQEITRRA